jgi:hypothetical protein
MRSEEFAEGPDRRRENPLEGGMVLGEAQPVAARRRRGPHGEALTLGQLDCGLPAAGGVDVGAGDERRALGRAQSLRERLDLALLWACAAADIACDLVCEVDGRELYAPVVHRDRDECWAGGGEARVVDRLGERVGHIGGPRRLIAPLHERLGHLDRVPVGQVRLHRDQCA